MNIVILKGNMTRDIEMRTTPGGTSVGRLGVALNKRWTDQKTGEVKEKAIFVECVAWGKTAENVQKFLSKGSPILIEGHLEQESWIDQATQKKRSRMYVVCDRLEFLYRAPAQEQGPGASGQGPAQPPAQQQRKGVAGIPSHPTPRQAPGIAAENAKHAAAAGEPTAPPEEPCGDLDIPEEQIPF